MDPVVMSVVGRRAPLLALALSLTVLADSWIVDDGDESSAAAGGPRGGGTAPEVLERRHDVSRMEAEESAPSDSRIPPILQDEPAPPAPLPMTFAAPAAPPPVGAAEWLGPRHFRSPT